MITVKGFEPTFSVFPNGEFNVSLSDSLIASFGDNYNLEKDVVWHFDNNDELIKLGILISTLETLNTKNLNIYVGYLPYSRMDRHQEGKHNPFSLKVFMNMLPKSDSILIKYIFEDVHNYQVTKEIADKIMHENNNILFDIEDNHVFRTFKELYEYGELTTNTLIILPDKGSLKRYKKYLENDKYFSVIDFWNDTHTIDIAIGYKERDFDTHEITKFGLNLLDNTKDLDISKYDNYVILDDVISYGNTFINLMNYLGEHGAKKRSIFIISGNVEDSLWRGDLLANEYLKRVYTTSNLTHHKDDDMVTIADVFY